ncbi:hypothetical protein Sru01_47650 [Sphaerisporangium rufum]|uniref:Histidine kinase/HSP90-like ATPase domain-containing protein n=1 Tax=Sphaerisporangium rufum TaxID=1381558 RepID=A0A919V379_9ACTN|nr:ATP-binding protein [Sphaerisporangium rufum]GII79783.1 hypothetical protein Sru01_47650 [Sphaerisporangium rufum]
MTRTMETCATPEYEYGPECHPALLAQKWIPHERARVGSVRRFVRDTALDWRAAAEVADIAELLASEVVTNALVHGGRDAPAASSVRVSVTRDGELMTVAVRDRCPLPPHRREPGSLESSGRGLAIVAALAYAWGWAPHHLGKSVWFQLVAWPAEAGFPGAPDASTVRCTE